MPKGYLFDENLPFTQSIFTTLPVFHVRDIGSGISDATVWEYAKANDLIIVSKDADFFFLISVAEPPPKVVHLRIGNMRLTAFLGFIANVWPSVEIMLQNNKLVNVYLDRLEGIGTTSEQ